MTATAQLGFVQIDPNQAPVWMGPTPKRRPPVKGVARHPITTPGAEALELEQARARERAAACLERRVSSTGLEVLGLKHTRNGMAACTILAYRLGTDRPWMRAAATSAITLSPERWLALDCFTEQLPD